MPNKVQKGLINCSPVNDESCFHHELETVLTFAVSSFPLFKKRKMII